MVKTRQIFFFTRLLLYLLAFSLPVVHPSIAVPYDRTGWWLWFVLVPAEMLIAFYMSPPRFRFRTWILCSAFLILISVTFISGFTTASFMFIAGGSAAFVLTVLIFKTGAHGQTFAILEQFFLGILYYKMLNFSRGSETVARENSGLTQVILVLIVCAFLLHGLVLYLSAFHSAAGRRGRKELFLFLSLAVPAVLVIAFILPPDFVSHSVVFNPINRDLQPRPVPLNEVGDGLEGGNLRSNRRLWDEGFRWGQSKGEREGAGREGDEGEPAEAGQALEGLPADQWGNQMGREGDNKQYAVMVVASPVDPVYAANGYFGQFDPVRGFLLLKDETLNEITYLRFLETWKDGDPQQDLKRYPFNIYYLSTLSERVLAYRPYAIEPTVLKRKFHPFDFSYNTISRISRSKAGDWKAIEGLTLAEKYSLKSYLEIPLPDSAHLSFDTHLRKALDGKTGYYEKIEALLRSFSDYQYEIGFTDDVSVGKLEQFLLRTKQGDCTEFSNTTAILARLAGIPSRVVTGYLASHKLQTGAHRWGIQVLREAIEPLRDFPPGNLYLVTTAHHHSWVQLYMPGYGWVDFETTSYALPPLPGGDPNTMDVVIPLILEKWQTERIFTFPWLPALRILLGLLILTMILIYLYRYGRELYLIRVSRGQDLRSLKALLKLLLMRLSVNGYVLKLPSQTPLEYSSRYPEVNRFASLYTMLRYREKYYHGEQARLWQALRDSYLEASAACRRSGLLNLLRRLFSLKVLYY